jgi:undecaprenyl diphosphate synthase
MRHPTRHGPTPHEATAGRAGAAPAVPRHIAIVMDGNGRWAAQRDLPRYRGHRAGMRSVREIVEAAAEIGVQVLTLYAFSVENWKRPPAEVNMLIALLRQYLRRELHTLIANDIQFRVIGRTQDLPPDVRREIDIVAARTVNHTRMVFEIAFNYGGRAEIVDAARRAIAAGILPHELDEHRFGQLLYTAGQPDPDLLIRTGGEMRLSNFLLWQIAHTEIWVTDTLWPEFGRRHLLDAIAVYQERISSRAERHAGGPNELAPVIAKRR